MTDRDCPICHGLGWYEGPYYGGLEPTVERLACPRCTHADPIGWSGVLIVAVIQICLVMLVSWVLW